MWQVRPVVGCAVIAALGAGCRGDDRPAPAAVAHRASDAGVAIAPVDPAPVDGALVDAAPPDAAPVDAAAPPTGGIHGTVTTSTSGGIKPPLGEDHAPRSVGVKCTVRISSQAIGTRVVKTGDDGRFAVKLPPGRYTVAFDRDCWQGKPERPDRYTVTVTEGHWAGASFSTYTALE